MNEKLRLVEFLREKVKDISHCKSETDVKQFIIQPILIKLGWDVFSPREVVPEYSTSSGRVDYTLMAGNYKIFIEAKKAYESLEPHQGQLLRYSFEEGANLSVLTNGIEWIFFLPVEPNLKWHERKLKHVNIENVEEASKIMSLLLSKEAVNSGSSIMYARSIIAQRIYIPKAWEEMLQEPDSLLVELLIEKTKEMFGVEPNVGAIKEFLSSQSSGELNNTSNEIPYTASPYTSTYQKLDAHKISKHGGKKRSYNKFILDFDGEDKEFPYISDLLIHLLLRLRKSDVNLFEKLYASMKNKKRKWIAKNIMELYEQRPDLCRKHNKKIDEGWYLGTNYSTREFKDFIRTACEFAGFYCRFEELGNNILKINVRR